MLVTFKTQAHGDITMFGTAAVPLLKLMGQSGNVPGALMAADVGPALDALRQALAAQPDTDTVRPAHADDSSAGGGLSSDPGGQVDVDDDELETVALSTRANPLIELLEAARAANENVLWEE